MRLQIDGRAACLIVPQARIDERRRWLWFSPGWMPSGISPSREWPGRKAEHEFYVRRALVQGFHVAGIECRVSCGSPKAIRAYECFYQMVTRDYGLNPRPRMVGQSNGGLMIYNWAARHETSVDRVLGIFPATDLRSWPGLEKACDPEFTYGNGYDMTAAELEARLEEFSPIEQLRPLAEAGVRILHLHGDEDHVVPLEPNSLEFARRYLDLGGEIEVIVEKGWGHVRDPKFYDSERAIEFLLA